MTEEVRMATDPSFDEMYPALATLRRHRPHTVEDFERALAIARRFRHAYVDAHALSIDRRVANDPTYVAQDAIEVAARHGLFGMMVPRVFGGMGLPFGAMAVAIEEISAGCVGIANLVAVHGLALSTVAATGDLTKMAELCRLIADSERTGAPKLLSTAITEPQAGTDVEDAELLRTARISCEARPVRGGYRLNGRKVFISNGSIAHTHVVIMPTDRRRPVETTFAFLVAMDTKGFTVGRVEHKMGQKACPAAELVFDNCFIPEDRRVASRPLPQRSIELVLGATRGAVGAFGAGVTRGAYERAVHHARTHTLEGRLLIDHQWVQLRLADMLRNVMIARSAYVEAMLSNERFGLASLSSGSGAQEMSRHLPRSVLESDVTRRLIGSRAARKGARRAVEGLPRRHIEVSSTYGSAAKVTTSDLALHNCHLALDVMGADGLRHDQGVEKLYRDAKLLQIYEGTNQLNRIEIFNKGVHGDLVGVGGGPVPIELPHVPATAVDTTATETATAAE
jgi:acyl-CoA dehydrogenase